MNLEGTKEHIKTLLGKAQSHFDVACDLLEEFHKSNMKYKERAEAAESKLKERDDEALASVGIKPFGKMSDEEIMSELESDRLGSEKFVAQFMELRENLKQNENGDSLILPFEVVNTLVDVVSTYIDHHRLLMDKKK